MKFYIHGEDPELTVVVVWEKDKPGTVQDVMEVFCESLLKKYPHADKRKADIKNYDVRLRSKGGKLLDHSANVCSMIKHMDDVFVTWIAPTDVKEKVDGKENMKVNAESSSVSKMDKETDKKLDGQNNAAVIHLNNERYRKAIQIYINMLSFDNKSKLALTGLTVCYLKAGRAKKALQYASQGLKYHQNDKDFLLLIGKCYVTLSDGENAITHLMKLCKLLRQTEKTTAEEKHEIQVLLAKAYLIKDEKDMAITILQGVLRENLEHTDALLEYAELLYPLGQAQSEEAITALLTVLARKQTDKRAKQVFTSMCTRPGSLDILRNIAGTVMKDIPALIYLAMCLKECSAVKESLELIDIAYKLDKSSPSTALIYVHLLELLDNHKDIVDFYKRYFQACPGRGIAQLTCALVNRYLSAVLSENLTIMKDELEAQKSTVQSECELYEVPSTPYTDDDLYFIALLCTLVKILYIKGLLPVIPPLLAMVKPFCEGKDMHLTIIRNEVAFFTCIQEVFRTYTEIPATLSPGQAGVVYLVGDSHCIPSAWQNLFIKVG